MRGTHDETSGTSMAAQLAQEARLFRVVHQFRQRQHCRVLEGARNAATEAHAAEAELVSALDIAQFAEDQLQPIASRAFLETEATEPGLDRESFSRDWRQSEHRRLLDDAGARLHKHQDLRVELGESRERAALAVAQIRVLRKLCALVHSGGGGRAQQRDGLASVLRRCEEGLLVAGRLWPGMGDLAADFQATSLYGLLLPIMTSEAPATASSAPTAEAGRWLLGASPPRQPATTALADEEEAALQRHVEELTSRRVALRSALQEAKHRQHTCGTPEQVERDIKELQRELADAYEHLALAESTPLDQELVELRKRLRSAQTARLEALSQSSGCQGDSGCSESELIGLVARHQAEITELKEKLNKTENANVSVPSTQLRAARPSLTPLKRIESAFGGTPGDDLLLSSSRSRSKSSVHESEAASPPVMPMPSSVVAAQRLKSSEYTALQRHGSAALLRHKNESGNASARSGGSDGGAGGVAGQVNDGEFGFAGVNASNIEAVEQPRLTVLGALGTHRT